MFYRPTWPPNFNMDISAPVRASGIILVITVELIYDLNITRSHDPQGKTDL